MLEYAGSHSAFTNFFKRTLVPDELFFHSIIMNSPFSNNVVNDCLRFIDWDVSKDRPHTLLSNDFDRLMQSPALFARKFDNESQDLARKIQTHIDS